VKRCDRKLLAHGRRYAAAAALLLATGGCAVGPDFVRPEPPAVENYLPSGAAGGPPVGAAAQRVALGKNVSAQWWKLFHSSRLDEVLDQSLAGNQTLVAARATLAQAQQAVIQAGGGLYPQLDASAAAQRSRASAAGVNRVSGTTFNLYSVGANVSYAIDVFGGTRRSIERQEALAEDQNYQLAAAYLALTGNAVTEAINIASSRLQLSTTQGIIADDEKNLNLVRQKFEAGKAARSDLLAAESQLANDRTLLPPLKQQLSAARHALSVLVGRFPVEWSPPDFDLTEFTLPADLPVSLPSRLVRQRPDILAAEAQLHAASAAVGVAAAQLYPSLTLTASIGTESASTATLFDAANHMSSVIAGLTAPLFRGGALTAQKQGAIDAFQASAASYKQTVLQAFAQVADTLRALEHDAELVAATQSALQASQASLELQRLSYAAGKSSLLQLLDAERADQQARLAYTRAQASRYQDSAALLVAMGGGWWDDRLNVPAPAATEVSTAH
jgi:NodT family efflux transporter outer membrane factor (OMF) lipoprotein